jgi:hypothetical protein
MDGYMPRQFAFRGDRLAYSWGIVLLAAVAATLVWRFDGNVTALIPLYSVGVFVCFTLEPDRHGPSLAARSRAGLGLALSVNGFGPSSRPSSSSSW